MTVSGVYASREVVIVIAPAEGGSLRAWSPHLGWIGASLSGKTLTLTVNGRDVSWLCSDDFSACSVSAAGVIATLRHLSGSDARGALEDAARKAAQEATSPARKRIEAWAKAEAERKAAHGRFAPPAELVAPERDDSAAGAWVLRESGVAPGPEWRVDGALALRLAQVRVDANLTIWALEAKAVAGLLRGASWVCPLESPVQGLGSLEGVPIQDTTHLDPAYPDLAEIRAVLSAPPKPP